jgi:hypothetical protein
MEEIRNKVEESGLIQLDLAQFRPQVQLQSIDIAEQLWQGLVIKEKEFRVWIKSNDWSIYLGKAVCIFCSADAIIPTWAYMLVASHLNGIAVHVTIGSKEALEKELIQSAIAEMDTSKIANGKVIIKGCSDISDPAFAMVCLLNKIQPLAQSIMYGEPCSTVPIFKKSKEKNEN